PMPPPTMPTPPNTQYGQPRSTPAAAMGMITTSPPRRAPPAMPLPVLDTGPAACASPWNEAAARVKATAEAAAIPSLFSNDLKDMSPPSQRNRRAERPGVGERETSEAGAPG